MHNSRKGPTGPKTPEGKRRSSLNALKHGLDARSPQAVQLIADELNMTFDQLLEDLRSYYLPRDPVEDSLVRRVARCLWRLTLSETMEQRMINRRGMDNKPGATYDRILRYERLVDIHLHRAITALSRHRASGSLPKHSSRLGTQNGETNLSPSSSQSRVRSGQ